MARCSPSLRSDCDVDRSILLLGGLVALRSAQHRKLPHGEPRLVEEAGVLEGLDVGEVAERVEAKPGEESLRRHMDIGRARSRAAGPAATRSSDRKAAMVSRLTSLPIVSPNSARVTGWLSGCR